MKNSLFKHNKVVYLIIAFLVTLFVEINGQSIITGYEINVGSPSPETFKAPRDIENTTETQRLKKSASESVSDLYKIDTEINNQVLGDINEFFLIAEQERENYKTFQSQANNTEENTEEPTQYETKLNTFLTEEQSLYLLELPPENYDNFKTGTIGIFEAALNQGIKEDNKNISAFYSLEVFSEITEDTALKEIGNQLTSIYLKPNLVLDADATNKAREEAIEAISPIMILKNQVIVSEGYIVTDEHYVILDELGFTQKTLQENILPIIGISIITLILFIVFAYAFHICFDKKKYSLKKFSLLFTVYTITILFTFYAGDFAKYINPILIGVLLIGLFMGYTAGLIYIISITIVSNIILGQDIDFIIFMLLASLIMLSVSKSLTERKTVFRNSIITTIGIAMIYLGISLLTPIVNNDDIFINLIYVVGYSFISYILAFGLIPIIEMSFGILTQNKLMELSNPNNELIKKLTMEAPGTYHHSLVVSNLAEAAAIEIGADFALARVGAYYHDIGKTQYPAFFTENQVGVNPHDNLSPWQSFKIIQNHVLYGIQLGKKHKLPEEIINMIPEHHGNSLVKYFYVKAKENNADTNEDDYRYGGRLPSTKESGILMLADTCEAAVRSMAQKSNSMEEIEAFVVQLIKNKMNDGQLVNSTLTIGDIENIKIAFMRIFKGLYHKRIEYPKTEEEKEEERTKEYINKLSQNEVKNEVNNEPDDK